MRETIYIFNKEDELLSATKLYTRGKFTDTVSAEVEFELEISLSEDSSKFIKEGNQVAFKDLDRNFRLFTIREVDKETSDNDTVVTATCLPAREELIDAIIEDRRPQNTTALNALTNALETSRWQVGNVADLGLGSTNFYYENALSCIQKILNEWGGELVDRIEISGNKISGRYIDIVTARGNENGKVFRPTKDIESLAEKVIFYPKTALYGIGSSEQTEAGGYTRKLKFSNVEWSVANGDPVDKPLGQDWVGSNDAKSMFGIPNGSGGFLHRFGAFEDSQETDPEVLLQKTWEEVLKRTEPLISYELDVISFESLAGYEHEKARLGDKVAIISEEFGTNLIFQSRIEKFVYDIGDPQNAEITVGNLIDYLSDNDDDINKVIDIVNDKSGIWDTVDDNSFPDITPPVPTNVVANGLFKNISLKWDYDPASYIAAYEVYASKVQGFVPTSNYLVWRGKTGGYAHEANTTETWYFRIRSINTHGTGSDFTPEISASTVKIITDDMMFGSVNADILAGLSVDASKLTDSAVTAEKIANLAVGNAAIANAAITNAKIDTLAVSTGQIQNAAITNAKIADLAVDSAKIADLAVTTAKIADASITNAKITNLSVTTAKIADASITNAKILDLSADKITAGTINASVSIVGPYISGGTIASGPTTISDGFISVGNYATSTALLFNESKIKFMGTVSNMGDPRESSYGGEISFDEFFSDYWGMNGNRVNINNAVGSIDITTGRDDGGITIGTGRFADSTNSHITLDSRVINLDAYSGVFINGFTPWTSGNDGSDSGLSADDVDGLHAHQFLRSDTSDSTSGSLTVGGSLTANSALVVGNGLTINGGNIRSTPTYNFTTSLASNMHIASSGLVYRSTSASKYKDDIQPITRDFNDILALEPKSWWDKAELAENNGDTTGLWRHHGLIAEDLVNAGLDELVIWYGGQPEGIQYERLAVYLIPIVKKLTQRVEDLERGL